MGLNSGGNKVNLSGHCPPRSLGAALDYDSNFAPTDL